MCRVVSHPIAGVAFAVLLLGKGVPPAHAQAPASGGSAGAQPAQVLIVRDYGGYEEIPLPMAPREGASWLRPAIHGQAFPPAEQQGPALRAAELGRTLDVHGKVVLGGILFDSRDELHPSSKPALDEIGALLKQRPGLRLHVVGHTDNIGALAGNRELSKRRAHAICVALVTDHGIGRNRLTANGMGSLSPMVSNQSGRGRARNQRVELVVQ